LVPPGRRPLVRDHADFPLGAVGASVVAIAERFDVDRVATLAGISAP
jgi:hypothetical protein